MRDDCPLSPLALLFTPAFLSTSRARFALIVANHCVPFMVQGGLTSTFKTLLDGDLRKFMKVTDTILLPGNQWKLC